jgi:hypothetical protein
LHQQRFHKKLSDLVLRSQKTETNYTSENEKAESVVSSNLETEAEEESADPFFEAYILDAKSTPHLAKLFVWC